ncbi:hypothetical protein KCP74_21860 [Salmonella enterica subsp. enterica]|nr:hypothetical protein KCP74_21860 [Salmonella enterica subsp. enterica]
MLFGSYSLTADGSPSLDKKNALWLQVRKAQTGGARINLLFCCRTNRALAPGFTHVVSLMALCSR